MKFVVAVPFSLYVLFVIVAISVGGIALYCALLVFSVLFLIFHPRLFISLVLWGVAVQLVRVGFVYWYIAAPALVLLAMALKKGVAEAKPLKFDWGSDK
ncbi:hypothetical protein [Roseateles sp. P5_D6]